MTSEIDEFRRSLVTAVQAELERHASAVVAEVDRLREEGRRDRAELHAQLAALAAAVEQGRQRADTAGETARAAFERRLVEVEQRQTRRLDDVTAGLEGLVQAAAQPVLADVRTDHEALVRQVSGLDANLRKFDEQAARMVTYFNDVTQAIEQRQDALADTVHADVVSQVAMLTALVEENDGAVRRFQNEVGQSVTQKLNDTEDRFNNRLLAAESRMREDAGQKIAEIDAHVGRVSAGLDDTMLVLNDRIAAFDDRFATVAARIDALHAKVQGIDHDAIEELKEKLSAAAGEAMLVRIEMERFEKAVNERTDGLTIRLTEVETAVNDMTMDVSTAVQLDRLEEIERALVELDPARFVAKADLTDEARDELLKKPDARADATAGDDGEAAVAAAAAAVADQARGS